MFTIKDYAQLREFHHIIWDIDGTITEHDVLNEEVTADIISLAHRHGVYHTFITGRDYGWIENIVMKRIKHFHNFRAVMAKLTFFAEVGSVRVDLDANGNANAELQEALREHPLTKDERGIRTRLKALAYDPGCLQTHEKGAAIPPDGEVIYDANGVGYVVKKPLKFDYIWSKYKRGFCTFEKIRDQAGKVRTFPQQPFRNRVRSVIEDAGFSDDITTEEVATAINVIPKVLTPYKNGSRRETIGKSWAAGQALHNVMTKSGMEFLDQVTQDTIAFGDGASDVLFTLPTIPPGVPALLDKLPMVFVGSERDLPREEDTAAYNGINNIIIQATGRGNLEHDDEKGIINLVPATGPRVVAAVLGFLNTWGYFKPLA